MSREWTPEQRKAHGEKIRATKEANKAKLNLSEQIDMARPDEMIVLTPPVKLKTRPRIWSDLNVDDRKCAKNASVPDDAPVYQDRCSNCRLPMWTRSKKEDICERCEFVLIDEKYRMKKEANQRRGGQIVNPFREVGDAGVQINPLRGGAKLL